MRTYFYVIRFKNGTLYLTKMEEVDDKPYFSSFSINLLKAIRFNSYQEAQDQIDNVSWMTSYNDGYEIVELEYIPT